MNRQPHLTGDLVELRPLAQEDYEDLLLAASDPKIWEQHPQPDRHQPEVFKKFFMDAMASEGALKILDRTTGKIIGSSRYYDHFPETSSVIVGYTFISRPYWGGKYNRDLKKLMVNYALKYVKTVYFQVGLKNLRSQKAMEKIGGVNIGIKEVAVTYSPPKPSYIYKLENPLA